MNWFQWINTGTVTHGKLKTLPHFMENLCNYFPVISAKFLRTSLILLRRSMERFPDWTRKKGIFDSIRCRNVIKCSDDRCFVLRLPFQVCSRAHWHVHVIQLHKFWNIYFHNLGYRGKICYRALYGRTSTQFTVCYIQCVLRGQQQLAETIVVRYWRQIHSCSATCASVDLVRTVSYLPCCSRDPASFSKKKKKNGQSLKVVVWFPFWTKQTSKAEKKKKNSERSTVSHITSIVEKEDGHVSYFLRKLWLREIFCWKRRHTIQFFHRTTGTGLPYTGISSQTRTSHDVWWAREDERMTQMKDGGK